MEKRTVSKKVAIIGAGPAGCTAALHLSGLGFSSVLMDKATFPRDKTCGDALSGKVLTVLNRIDPEIVERFRTKDFKEDIFGMRLFAPNRVILDLPFKWQYDTKKDDAPGSVVPRYEMDNFLIEEVRRKDDIELLESIEIASVKRFEDGFEVIDTDGNCIAKANMLLVANGANSKITRQLIGLKKDDKHYAGAVRGYYENVSGFHPDGFIELHFLKEYIPGYFWIFPVAGNRANVGLGMRTDLVSKNRINLKKTLEEIIRSYPGIADRFKDAKPEGKIKGYPLPLGSKKIVRSGERFMLLGDAAQLIDPLTGEGVGNAIYSGWIAAEQVASCFDKNSFDADEMRNYDKRIQRVMGVELKLSRQLQRLMTNQWLVNSFASRISRHDRLREFLTRMYTDLELRKKLVNPWFILQVLLGKK
jgi:geranylgeranyl reductase family protein